VPEPSRRWIEQVVAVAFASEAHTDASAADAQSVALTLGHIAELDT